ncbi:ankyrin repeat-containing domain protein [Coprinopsis sp. MPI-PUGE-AT-0042]|nr:ankyrin repeat-containing domain protein [Coprinopsis sp. MPI-PUGE-AT-0042]
MLEALISQLCERHPDTAKAIRSVFTKHTKERTKPSEKECVRLLADAVKMKKTCFFILDGLDETSAENQQVLVRLLSALDIKLFVTSRPLPKLQPKFPQATFLRISAQEVDIKLHIDERMSRNPDLEDLLADPQFKEDVVRKIITKADGMFLHAALQLEALCHCLSRQEAIKVLEQFPPNLHDAYWQTWRRLEAQVQSHVDLAKRALLWVIYACREISLDGLRHFIATSSDDHRFDSKRMVSEAALLSACCGLLKVDERSKRVRLVHFTAKDALEPLLRQTFGDTHSLIALVCIEHMAMCGMQDAASIPLNAAFESDPLLRYAYSSWSHHAHLSKDALVASKTHKFISGCTSYPITAYHPPHFGGALHVAAWFGFATCLLALSGVVDPNQVSTNGSAPLVLATVRENVDCVEALLSFPSITVNAGKLIAKIAAKVTPHMEERFEYVDLDRGGSQSNALHIAVMRDYRDIAGLLLQHPAINPNLINFFHCFPPLRNACIRTCRRRPPTEFVDNASQFPDHTPACPDLPIVALLLAHPHLDVNMASGNDGRTALMAAVAVQNVDAIELLLQHPMIDVNIVDSQGWTALALAYQTGIWDVEPQIQIVCLLLKMPGIDTTILPAQYRGQTLQSLSSASGWTEVARLLDNHKPRSAQEAESSLSEDSALELEDVARYFTEKVV